jgi:pimeloyl-ACP methyl ester carboxylesterase
MLPRSRQTGAVPDSARGRLRRPAAATAPVDTPPGRHDIEVDGSLAGVLYVPEPRARRVVISLHGAGGSAEAGLRPLLPYADEHGLALYAPESTAATWDLITGGFGPDVSRIQAALALLPPLGTPVLAGFSDGASYALSLALTNGDVFGEVIAFSPGFATTREPTGRPRVFISHGRGDRILPIDRCGRRLARGLTSTGYSVEYLEFDGGHEIPADVATAALRWLGSP